MKTGRELFSKERENTIESLVDLLRKARSRWTLLLFVSFVGLLSSLASIDRSGSPSDAARLLQAYDALIESRFAERVRSRQFQTSLPINEIKAINEAESQLRQVNQELSQFGIESQDLDFFTLGPEYFELASAVLDFLDEKPPSELLEWNQSHLDKIYTIFSGLNLNDKIAINSEKQVRLSNSVVVERNSSTSVSIKSLKAFSRSIDPEFSRSDLVKRLTNALTVIEKNLAELNVPSQGWPKKSIQNLSELKQILEIWQVSNVATGVELAKARVTAGILESGSLSVAGFSIPGVASRLLLPVLALAISIDIILTLLKAVRWVEQSMKNSDAEYHVALFPWIPILVFGGRTQTGALSVLLSSIAAMIHLSPPIILLSLLVGATGSMAATVVAGVAIVSLAGCQVGSLWLISRLSKQSSDIASYRVNLNDPTVDQLKTHFERIDFAWMSLMTISGATSIFLIAFLFVPSELLGDRVELDQLRITRAALEEVYNQRFKEHRDTYSKWSNAVNDSFFELSFMQIHFPEEHPGYRLIEDLSQKPPLITYPSAKSNFDDIVTDDRASISQLDLVDIKDLIELLYRPDFEDLIEPLSLIRDSIKEQPLAEDAMAELPVFLKPLPIKGGEAPMKMLYGSVSGSGIELGSPSAPLPITYRQEVEKGGFAYRLTPLPVRQRVDDFYEYMVDKGFARVGGFDEFSGAYKEFDKQLGTLKLSLFGVLVDRRVATTVASLIIVPLLALLLLRLIVAIRVVDDLDDQESCATILSATGITFLNDGAQLGATHAMVNSILLLAFPMFVLILIEWSSVSSGNAWPWSAFAIVIGLLLAFLCVRARLILLGRMHVFNGA